MSLADPLPLPAEGNIYSLTEIETILGFKLPLNPSSTPFLRHKPVGRDFVDTILSRDVAMTERRTSSSSARSSTPLRSAGATGVPLLCDEVARGRFAPPSCALWTRIDAEDEWRDSIAAEEIDFSRKMNQVGTPMTSVTAASRLSDNIMQWRTMNWSFSLRAKEPPVRALAPLPGAPSAPLEASPRSHVASQRLASFSPGQHQLASVLLNLEAPAPRPAKKPATTGPGSLMSPMSQLTRTASQLSARKAEAEATAAAATAAQPAEASSTKRGAAAAGLASDASSRKTKTPKLDEERKTAKATRKDEASLSPPKPLRYPLTSSALTSR